MIKTNKKKIWLVLAAAMTMGVVGCSGDDGKDGSDGENGGNGNDGDAGTSGLHIDMANEAIATITNATYAEGIITVDFDLENKQGVGLFGLSGTNEYHDFRFSLAQLETNTGSELKQWISLLNETTNDTGTTFEQGFEKIKDCSECLVDNKDGTYTYNFKTNLVSATDAAGVVFDPALTQRIAIEMQFEYASGHELAENAHYDWIPATNSIEGIEKRELVTLETCYTCHQPDSLEAHGGRRLDLENCQSCHNGIVTDPNAVSVELGHMVHAIHMGPEREGKDAEGNVVKMPYTIAGYGGDHAFDYPAFPTKPFMDCAVCHVQDEALADKDLWLANANANACTGCHTDSPAQHKSDKNPALVCTDCHSAAVHTDREKPYQAAKEYSVEVSDVTISAANLIEFEMKIMDAEGVLVSEAEVYKQGYSKPYMVVSWDVEKDYPDYNQAPYSSRRVDIKDPTKATWNADNTVSVAVTINFPVDIAARSLEVLPVLKVCFEEGSDKRVACDAENAYPAYVQTPAYRTVLGDSAAVVGERRSIVDTASCHGCHSYEFYHDSNGVNCIACHTNDKSLKGNGQASNGVDLLKSTSFMYKAHKATGHDNGHGGSGTILKTDCTTCHSATEGYGGLKYGFELGRNGGQAHAVPSTQSPAVGEVVETWYASSDAAACMSCHQKYLSDAAMSHIRSNGGYFGANKDADHMVDVNDAANAKDAKEACATCHSPEKIMAHHGHTL
ncbi:OmcA/MtrC family decaheme c-type cytochrome [Shewanella nanhaiensis]|uniref:OmcA/MtrC family decaheme c-type cytochrome n=1 Tax=Shewanella nanhaiensis TaxID=2864872 RepID=A0ABS7DZB5_9GAMM|nr:OmcA/MtrC family decaheme c-type cytochrome [Shewanella nanhaiensis]MBW8182704.1 OmcA/MtrC family decaheme c-type cytochrome [Shewanella nanhaiensis]